MSNKALVRQCIEAFFEHVYPIPCYSYLHRPTFLRKWSQGFSEIRLLKAVCGLGARFICNDQSEHQALLTDWMNAAETEVMGNLATFSVTDVETLQLVALDHCITRQFARMMIASGLAARLAYIMRLNCEDTKPPFVVRESRRRLMWSIFAFDTLYSSGRSELTSCARGTIRLQLPCSERHFFRDNPVTTESIQHDARSDRTISDTIGTTAFLLRILDVRDRIQR